jgi:hypothetical protein
VPGAQERHRAAKDQLAQVTADLELLQAAKAEHEQRQAAKLATQRAAAHAEKVKAVRADLDAGVKAAERLTAALSEVCAAYDDLVASRSAALSRGVQMPLKAAIRLQEVRQLVGNELFRVGSRLNEVNVNDRGLPAPEVQDLRWHSNPALIPPLAERLKQQDTYTLAALEGQMP